MKTKYFFLIAFAVFIGYAVFAWFYNQNQEKKNLQKLDELSRAKAVEPQMYDASGNPITGPIITYDIVEQGKIFDPIQLLRGTIGMFGFLGY
ncbi:hypothetical protein [Runella slithyformis]|uniref:Uncharacterized protein n=1 Tax=Runella slithyformis (strain ATCC 29530 / DSM 19594 / LMG 11500 / NCIMB 11436 / LSU 4) TaxID=761193 RepID=A0A7U3ZI87_RUNSL|nr:hypothetical protein [Runella slithyformis]AEI47685.1 hypothetical protein Runsl_1258 [Runella slithyformis DSM 19594]